MTAGYLPPVLPSRRHVVDVFECRSQDQTIGYAVTRGNRGGNRSNQVLVVTPAESTEMVAYETWRMAAIAVEAAPPRLRRGAGRYPRPVVLLARLGVSQHHERLGLGTALLQDVFARTAAVGREIGFADCWCTPKPPQARDFYRHLIPEFEPLPTDELHVALLMKEIARSLCT